MIEKLFSRVELPFPNNKIQIFSDGNDDYVFTLPEYYADTCIDYGKIVKIRENGRVVDKRKRTIFGNPDTEDIETTNIENFNGIMSERVSEDWLEKQSAILKRNHGSEMQRNSFNSIGTLWIRYTMIQHLP